jgi:hypothetical protein
MTPILAEQGIGVGGKELPFHHQKERAVASITREANGRRLIQFVAGDGKRKSIRLGKATERIAEEIKVKVEHLPRRDHLWVCHR